MLFTETIKYTMYYLSLMRASFLFLFFSFQAFPQVKVDSLGIFCDRLSKIKEGATRYYENELVSYYSLHKSFYGDNYKDFGRHISKFSVTREDSNATSLEILYEREEEIYNLDTYMFKNIEEDLSTIEINLSSHLHFLKDNLSYHKTSTDTIRFLKGFDVFIKLYNYKRMNEIIYDGSMGNIRYKFYVKDSGVTEFIINPNDKLNSNQNNIQFAFLMGYNLIKKSNSIRNKLYIETAYEERKDKKERKNSPRVYIKIIIRLNNIYAAHFKALQELKEYIDKLAYIKKTNCKK